MTGDSLETSSSVQQWSWQDWLLPSMLAVLAAYLVLDDLILSGPMAWHVAQPTALQGGLEALVLAGLSMIAAWRGGLFGRCILILLGAFYLRRHHVDLPVLATLLSVETLLSLGLLILRQSSPLGDAWRSCQALLAGALVWWALMLGMHALGFGTPPLMLATFAGIAVLSLLLRRRSLFVLPAWRMFEAQTPGQRALLALTLLFVLVQFARSNVVIGYDTLWYLARGQYVLAPNGSLFESLGLVSAVHYAPKLWEAWMLPWEALQDLSFQFGQALVFVCAGVFLVSELCGRLGMPKPWRPLVALTLLTLPALMATALQLKNDVLAWYLVLMMLVAACRWLDQRQLGDLCWVLATAALALSAKLTVLPMVAAIVLVLVCFAIARGYRNWRYEASTRADQLVLVLSCLIAAVLLYRTWHLCGLPTIGPEPLVKLWQLLGFGLRPPAGSLHWLWPQDWSSAWRLLPEALLFPSALPKIQIAWTGHVWLLCGLLAVAWQWRQAHDVNELGRPLRLLLWPLIGLGLLLFFAWRYETRGGDGNYYLVPVTAACVLSFSAATRLAMRRGQQIGLGVLLVISIVLQAELGFVSAAWSAPGTRAWDLALLQSPFDTEQTLRDQQQTANLDGIDALLRSMPAATRTLVVGPSGLAHLLPTRVEALENLAFSRPEYIADGEQFRSYLELACIKFIVVDKLDRPEVYQALQLAVAPLPHQQSLDGPRWQLIQIASCTSPPKHLSAGA